MGDVSINSPTETSEQGNTALTVFVQDQTTEMVDLLMHVELNTSSLSADSVIGNKTIELTAGHGTIAGNYIEIAEGQRFAQWRVQSVATNTITLDDPVDQVFTSAGADVEISSTNMAVNGSTTPVVFQIDPIAGQTWDITRVIIVIESTANSMDFTTFGSIAPITNGCLLRTMNGQNKNLFNWKTNGDFINRSFDALFQSKAGGGGSGFTSRTTFGGQSRRGVVVRLNGTAGDQLQVVIQDDVSAAALTKFQIIVQGHVVQ